MRLSKIAIRWVGVFAVFAVITSGAKAADEKNDKKGKDMEKNPIVQIKTSEGDIKVELWKDKAPITVENFLAYVEDDYYDGTIFHRVIDNFMIQGGGFTADMKKQKTKAPIKNEARSDTPNERGTIAMARTGEVDSATAQFFINVKDNAFLNHRDETPRGFGYAVFGRVTEGMDVVDKIKGVKTGNRSGMQDVPLEPVVIENISVVESAE